MLISNMQQEQKKVVDIGKLYSEYSKDYRNLFVFNILDHLFLCRPLSRLEYKEILKQENLNKADKEEVICSLCTVWPEDFDFPNCEIAGIPTALSVEIIERSGVNSTEIYHNIINHFREEISSDLDAQIACVINEAFPNLDIEEIESWDIEKTAKYLSRAEYILTTFRGVNENLQGHIDNNHIAQIEMERQVENPEAYSQEITEEEEEVEEVNLKGGKKQKIDLDELREFQQKFPEFDISQDAILNEGMDALKVESDTTPFVFRTGYEDEEI